ncbi:MAG: methylenetetrahydrofolate reductase [Planctomycetes bacterium]|nr:methylenetetrahydrofolate reductase [Planctomycetota bacterium]
MSNFSEALQSGKFVVTGEIGPPKGTNVEQMFEEAEHLRGKVAAINVTDIQSSVMRVSSLAVCIKLREMGLEPVLQMVCRDRNRLALQSDLLGAAIWGIENVLCLTGDHVSLGDHKEAKGVFDLDSVTLLKAANTLASGKDMAGNDLDGTPSFFTGAVVSPASEPVEPQIIKMKAKVEAGAKFFQTQAVYDPQQMEDFMKKVSGFGVPVLAGIVLLKSAGMAKFMNSNVAGVQVPDALIEEMASVGKKERKKKSVEIAARLIKQMKDCCNGVHIMPLGWDSLVPKLLDQAGL